jgi:hypothetical protein
MVLKTLIHSGRSSIGRRLDLHRLFDSVKLSVTRWSAIRHGSRAGSGLAVVRWLDATPECCCDSRAPAGQYPTVFMIDIG